MRGNQPQPQGSLRDVLVVSLLSGVSPSAGSTELQFGTDAGMSSVLLTMILPSLASLGEVFSNRCPLLLAEKEI